ncbi:MAG: hypothetical protein UZ14_CFX002000120 [Chloroflexi bacterium OLB14]|nr:MAG: hypothetical protein UZ14_CFX002000120 [Chloroflexi bacterium OLB14]
MSAKTVKKSAIWSDEEKAAMRERAKELKAEARMNKDREAGEKAVMAEIAKMPEPDRSMAKRIHEIVKTNAPMLLPRTWYGMPAYTNADGKVVCFFKAASKYNMRYASFGFQEAAKIDDGNMWADDFAIVKMTATEEAKITALVKKAVS